MGRLFHLCSLRFLQACPSIYALSLSPTDTSRSFEAFARICVSGLILDPEVPVSSLFTSPSVASQVHPNTAAAIYRPTQATSSHSTTQLGRKATLLHRIRDFYGNVTRPFALSNPPPGYDASPMGANSAVNSTVNLIASAPPGRRRTNTGAPLLEKMPSSSSNVTANTAYTQKPGVLILPFQFSINRARGVTRRNLPYLRHSWTRTDAVSLISFWVSFVLAQTGIERGKYHIGLFRALSVLRTARLLTITSGTTVSSSPCAASYVVCAGHSWEDHRVFQTIMHSLKLARPLLASVAYFVLFAMVLFSYVSLLREQAGFFSAFAHRIIGIQSFNGSLRRGCFLQPTLGEAETPLTHMCGGYIDPVTLSVQPYVTQNGRNVTIKGYICPLGQVCKVCGVSRLAVGVRIEDCFRKLLTQRITSRALIPSTTPLYRYLSWRLPTE